MKSFGYVSGGGLGANLEGSTEVIRAIRNRGQAGVGFDKLYALTTKDGDFIDAFDPRQQDHWFSYRFEDDTDPKVMRRRFHGLRNNPIDFESNGYQAPEVLAPKGGKNKPSPSTDVPKESSSTGREADVPAPKGGSRVLSVLGNDIKEPEETAHSFRLQPIKFLPGGTQDPEILAPKALLLIPPPQECSPAPETFAPKGGIALPFLKPTTLVNPQDVSAPHESWEDRLKRRQKEKEDKDKDLSQYALYRKTGVIIGGKPMSKTKRSIKRVGKQLAWEEKEKQKELNKSAEGEGNGGTGTGERL